MTTLEAINAAIAIDPKRSWCASIERWYYRQTDRDSPQTGSSVFKLGCTPAFNPLKTYQEVSGPSFANCIEQIRQAAGLPNQTAEVDEEE